MCFGNRAQVSELYVNGQLRALFENAQHCAEKHLKGLKPTARAVEYATCLAEFYGAGRHGAHHPYADLAFAKFDCPRVEFVCNHEVVLFLNLAEVHYIPDFNEITQKKASHEAIDSCTLAFRIPLSFHTIDPFPCKAIGNAANYTSTLHILDMESAVFEAKYSSFPGENNMHATERKQAALSDYLIKYYLPFLKRAGHHVLSSLPDFHDLTSTTANIDYSEIRTRSLATDTLFGVDVEDVNNFLRGLWLQAAAFVDERGPTDTVSETFLAELRLKPLDAIDDIRMDLRFRPLYVRPLCKREVILYLDIQDIRVNNGSFKDVPKEDLTDWKIAFTVDIIFEEIDGGSSRRIKLDVATARFCEHLSNFGERQDVEMITRIKTTLVRQVTTYYLSILTSSETRFIYTYYPKHPGDPLDPWSDEDNLDVDVEKDILTETRIADFDLVTALTQGSINAHFKALWESAHRRLALISSTNAEHTWENNESQSGTCLAKFSFVHPQHGDGRFFSVSFSAPELQLICNEGSHRAIFHLNITDGHLTTLGPEKSLQPGSQAHPFKHWRLAFEVDLKIIDSCEDTVSSTILRRLGLDKSTGLKQLVICLSSAKLNLSLSVVPGLLEGTDCHTIRARHEALVYYIRTCYFPLLQRAYHDVLYTIPKDIPGVHGQHHLLTSLQFELVPFSYASGVRHPEGIFGRYRAIFERNAIVIAGMTGGRPLPRSTLPRGVNWVCGFGKDIPYGTVYLSRKSFLEGVILERLERINRKTTIVPTFSGIKNGQWVLELVTWDDHKMKRDTECNWREVTKKTDFENLEFEWKNTELWRYEHHGDIYNSGIYSVECITNNILIIPTSRTEKSAIQLKGAAKMHLKYEGEGRDWSSETAIHWLANIVFGSTSSGLDVQLNPTNVVPDIHPSRITYDAPGYETHTQALRQLKKKFPNVIDFTTLLHDLKNALGGAWAGIQMQAHELCVAHPVFSRHGDLLLDLIVSNGAQGTLSVQRSVPSLNGCESQAVMNDNGNASSEHWLRNGIPKAGEMLQFYSPSISRVSSSSKLTSSTFVSQEKVTQQVATTKPIGEVEDYSVADVPGEEL